MMEEETRTEQSGLITEELRDWMGAATHNTIGTELIMGSYNKLLAIADRIDAEHEHRASIAFANGHTEGIMDGCARYDAEHTECMLSEPHGYMELPKDADGEVIHIGDEVTEHEDGHTFKVDGFMDWDGEWWVFQRNAIQAPAKLCTHYHAPTVEDVLREIVHKCQTTYSKDGSYTTGLTKEEFAEYAAKLRLAGDE